MTGKSSCTPIEQKTILIDGTLSCGMRKVLYFPVLLVVTFFGINSCKKETGTSVTPTVPRVEPVLLKEMNVSNLPSPYYHFEYNTTGKPTSASFASGLFIYDIVYSGDRISEMKNTIVVNRDRLLYQYDNAGRVTTVRYADSTGIVFKKINLTYSEQKLIKLESELKSGTGFILEKKMTFSYNADGNLSELTNHRPTINGQPEYTFVDRFEQYDNKMNVDGFSLLHTDFFDHVVLLPGVQLQENNPGKLIRTGNGVNYKIDYAYTYNDKNLPVTKKGEATITNGSDAGKRFMINSMFSYY